MPESPTPNSQLPNPKEQLTETILDWGAATRIEHESPAIRNVALSGIKSQNGYRYSETALREAAPLYERVPVFLDHPADVRQPRGRSTRDLAGRVRNVRFENDRLRGDLELFDTEAGRTLLALAESDGPGVGMSHVVLAERNQDGSTVQRILEVISVDAVVFPATTTTFHENTNPKRQRGNENHSDPAARNFDSDPRGLAQAARKPHHQETLPGSLERLVAAIDRRLPDHARQLAIRSGLPCPGQGRRVALFPRHIVVEWRAPGFPPRPAASRSPGGLMEGASVWERVSDPSRSSPSKSNPGATISAAPARNQQRNENNHSWKAPPPSPATSAAQQTRHL